MLQSQLFQKTKKEFPKDSDAISFSLLVKGDFIEKIASGVYAFLPLGWMVHKKIEKIVREEMFSIGAQEIYLPSLIPKNLWEETKRWTEIDPPLFKVKDRHGSDFALASTHEEVVTELVRKRTISYKDLPFSVFQIQNKFRNEMRPTGGLLRTREFIMKDLYSFHSSKTDALNFYEKVKKAYFRVFRRCGLNVICVEADSGTIGGELSHEFMVISERGEDEILVCESCKWAGNIEKFKNIKKCPECKKKLNIFSSIEVGHTFYLGEKYSQAMKCFFTTKDGKRELVKMGCYGIGLGRLLSTVVEINHDKNGILWPKELSPFEIHLIPIGKERKVREVADTLYKDLQKEGFEILYDDRKQKSPGESFAEADLIGVFYRIIVSEKTLKKRSVEVKKRSERKGRLVKIKMLRNFLKKKLKKDVK